MDERFFVPVRLYRGHGDVRRNDWQRQSLRFLGGDGHEHCRGYSSARNSLPLGASESGRFPFFMNQWVPFSKIRPGIWVRRFQSLRGASTKRRMSPGFKLAARQVSVSTASKNLLATSREVRLLKLSIDRPSPKNPADDSAHRCDAWLEMTKVPGRAICTGT